MPRDLWLLPFDGRNSSRDAISIIGKRRRLFLFRCYTARQNVSLFNKKKPAPEKAQLLPRDFPYYDSLSIRCCRCFRSATRLAIGITDLFIYYQTAMSSFVLTSVFVSQLLFIPAVMDSSFAIVTRDATSPW